MTAFKYDQYQGGDMNNTTVTKTVGVGTYDTCMIRHFKLECDMMQQKHEDRSSHIYRHS